MEKQNTVYSEIPLPQRFIRKGDIILIAYETEDIRGLQRSLLNRMVLGKIVSIETQTSFDCMPYLCFQDVAGKRLGSKIVVDNLNHVTCDRKNIITYSRDIKYICEAINRHHITKSMDLENYISTNFREFF